MFPRTTNRSSRWLIARFLHLNDYYFWFFRERLALRG